MSKETDDIMMITGALNKITCDISLVTDKYNNKEITSEEAMKEINPIISRYHVFAEFIANMESQ